MNEIGFRVDCGRDRIVLTLNIQKFSKTADPDNLKSSYSYLNSGDGDYITLYHSDTLTGFASLYRLQKYRYTEPRLSPLTFLNKQKKDDQ